MASQITSRLGDTQESITPPQSNVLEGKLAPSLCVWPLWGQVRLGGYALPFNCTPPIDDLDIPIYHDPRDFTPADRATVYDHFMTLDKPDLSNDEFIVAHLSK